LEAKEQGIIDQVAPHIAQLKTSGMWISEEVQLRILRLAREV
jgi:predicted nucleic acid-binding protein